jgi:alkylation response protein AidB-like acyl-CoA dehydrogenase
MDFSIPPDVQRMLATLDEFIARAIAPREREHPKSFDHRREHARTDWEHAGSPRREWEALLAEMRRRTDAAGHLRDASPQALGGREASNLAMAIVREHLAAKASVCTMISSTSRRSSATFRRPHDGGVRQRRAASRVPARFDYRIASAHPLREA